MPRMGNPTICVGTAPHRAQNGEAGPGMETGCLVDSPVSRADEAPDPFPPTQPVTTPAPSWLEPEVDLDPPGKLEERMGPTQPRRR